MNDKKNIDRLFQEKFKNFEVTPDESVWEKIKAHQEKDRKRAFALPFWYRTAGIAASIALLLGIGYVSLNNQEVIDKNTIVVSPTDPNENKTESLTDPNQKLKNSQEASKEDVMVVTNDQPNLDKKLQNTDSNTAIGQGDYVTSSTKKETNITLPKEEITQSKTPLIDKKPNPIYSSNNQEKIAENTVPEEHRKEDDSNRPKEISTHSNNAVATTSNNNIDDNTAQEQNTLLVTPENQDNSIATTPENLRDSENSIAEETTPLNSEENTSTENEKGKSIFEAVKQPEEEEAIAEKSKSTRKWNVSPNVAPVYYDVIGDGSSIDPQFSDNSKDGQVNLSYGINVSYAVNKKLSIRSGVSKVNLSYNTEDVGFTASARGQNLQSIDYNPNAQAIFVSDIGNQNESITSEFVNRAPVNQKQNIGLLNQRIDYIEVPMEMKYALVNKKLGVNMIGGVSTLFLQDNAISIEAGDFETSVGEANNLNDVSFSGNIGLGVDYKLTDQFQINFEPIFKYQFNAFNGNAENFRPYYFGVYTGVSIRF